MKQSIRHKTFETNSSSIHNLVICKTDKTDTDYELMASEYEHNIGLEDFNCATILDEPLDILSYLYSYSVVTKYWKLYDLIKTTFPNCIFEKPRYDLPWNSKKGYCDDRSIISFCDVINCSITPLLEVEAQEYILDHLARVVFNGKISIQWDIGFRGYLKEKKEIKDVDNYIKENFENIL